MQYTVKYDRTDWHISNDGELIENPKPHISMRLDPGPALPSVGDRPVKVYLPSDWQDGEMFWLTSHYAHGEPCHPAGEIGYTLEREEIHRSSVGCRINAVRQITVHAE